MSKELKVPGSVAILGRVNAILGPEFREGDCVFFTPFQKGPTGIFRVDNVSPKFGMYKLKPLPQSDGSPNPLGDTDWNAEIGSEEMHLVASSFPAWGRTRRQ